MKEKRGEKGNGTSARYHTLVFLKPGVLQFNLLPKRGLKPCVANFFFFTKTSFQNGDSNMDMKPGHESSAKLLTFYKDDLGII